MAYSDKLIDHFETVFGNQSETVIAKAPGRVNLIGMHIDHQGGAVNPIAISETRVIAQPRSDDKIILKNMPLSTGTKIMTNGFLEKCRHAIEFHKF